MTNFMQPEIVRGYWAQVHIDDTDDYFVIPAEYATDPSWEALATYCPEWLDPSSVKTCRVTITAGWCARLSAPGHTDATDWIGPYMTARETFEMLAEIYDLNRNGE